MQCGLLGRTLGHSYSPLIHSALGDYAYDLYEKEPEELEAFLKQGEFRGLNVTIPYKQAVIPFLDELTPTASRLGAVNTILRREDGSFLGHNTDFYGFQAMLDRSGLNVCGKKVLVLGSGGASKPVTAALQDRGARVVVISRSGEDNYENLDRHKDAAVIVNTTPLGMAPNTGVSALSLEGFPALEGVLDLIYNPARTRLLLEAEKRGLKTENGLWMLVSQAWESGCVFTGREIPKEVIGTIHSRIRRSVENLILIGMPGSGKTTVGRLAAEQLHREFVDADQVLEEKFGPIPAIFKAQGEAGFRKLETQVLSELGKRSGLVIATGGGCVTRQENYDLLHQNGRILLLQRDLSRLGSAGRPLSLMKGVGALYRERRDQYAAFADAAVRNMGSPQDCARQILKVWEEE